MYSALYLFCHYLTLFFFQEPRRQKSGTLTLAPDQKKINELRISDPPYPSSVISIGRLRSLIILRKVTHKSSILSNFPLFFKYLVEPVEAYSPSPELRRALLAGPVRPKHLR